MKLQKLPSQKNRAQAMVEFAIALPIILMLLYGILEAGRLLFLYSSIVTASRQAVRYGSATGIGTNGVLRYQDCAGIRAIAQRADFLNSFDDNDIYLYYDTGPNTTKTLYCTGVSDPSLAPATNNYRLSVEIKGDFFPIIPKLVPFIERSQAKNNPIIGESARTILVAVSIDVTAPPMTFVGSTPTHTPSPTNTPTPTKTNTPTPTNTPTLVFTNTPSRTPTKTLTPSPTLSPTITNTPTITPTLTEVPTGVTGCNAITHGTIQISGNTMTVALNSPVPSSVNIGDLFVAWNHDKGHQTGSDKGLQLISVSIGNFSLNTSPLPSVGPSIDLTSSSLRLPSGASTLTFTFNQSYDNRDGSEEVLINLSSPGCTSYPIYVK